ncbi:hypothetical protein QUA42_25775 [Microcoleus sp. Pol11C2]
MSEEELEDFFAKKDARNLADKVMRGDEQVLVSDKTFAAFP